MNSGQSVFNHGGAATIGLAYEGQGQVQLLAALPPRARHAALEQQQRTSHLFRNRQRHEQPHYSALRARGRILSGRRARKSSTAPPHNAMLSRPAPSSGQI